MKNINLMTLVAFLVGFVIAYLYTADGVDVDNAASDHDHNTNENYAANLEIAQNFMQLHEVEDLKSDVYTQRQRGDGYKEGYKHKKQIIRELEEKLENMTEARDYYQNHYV